MQKINFINCGGAGDQLLGIRLSCLLMYIKPDYHYINNYCCCRDETWNMLETLFAPQVEVGMIQRLSEDFIEKNIKTQEDLDNFEKGIPTYLVWPDKLFRGLGAPPLKEWNITNFSVKQTRTLLGKWKPENYISLAINSITPGYTYHSVPELAYQLAKTFPDKQIYLPLLIDWNGKAVPKFNFNNPPDNLIIDVQPEFSKVYDILCKSEISICTDNAILHILDDLGAPYVLLDPKFNQPAFAARWRMAGFYNSVPISALVEDIVHVVKTRLEIPETQMIPCDQIFRQDRDWKETLIFKE